VAIFLFYAFVSVSQEEFLFLVSFGFFLMVLTVILWLQYKKLHKENRLEQKPYPQILWGMLAIFVYVGVEVTIQSNLGALLKTPEGGGYSTSEIGPFVSLYWGSLMIGRWTGSIGAFRLGRGMRIILTILVPFLALMLVLFMNSLSGVDVGRFFSYSICVALLIAAFFIGQQKPALTLILFSVLGTVAMVIGLMTTGIVSIYAFLSGGLFCSIMWPCIFSLGTAGLGKYTSQASGFLIMMILGGAIIPPLQGLIADKFNIHYSYSITVFCFAFLAIYGFKVKGILRKNGIDYDTGYDIQH
jgi:FHS family L-fucose permease-like MFS transporter